MPSCRPPTNTRCAHLDRGGRHPPPLPFCLLALLALEHLDLFLADPAPHAVLNLCIMTIERRSRTDRVVAGERLASLSLRLRLSLQVGSPFGLLGLPLLARIALLLLPQQFLDNTSDTVDFVPERGEGVLQILHFGSQRVGFGLLRIASGCRCCQRSGARHPERIESLLLRRQGRVEVGVLRPKGSDDPFEVCRFRPTRSKCPSVKPPTSAAR